MKRKARILTLLLAIMTIMSPFVNVANAANYKSTQTASDPYATITKSARWTNNNKTEAEITINVETKKPEIAKAENADFIYVLDKSYSMGDRVNLKWNEMKKVIEEKLGKFIAGEYIASGNRVAFATFSSNTFVYTNGVKKIIRYKNDNGKDLSGLYQVPDAETAKRFYANGVKKAGAINDIKFYTTTNEVEKVITGFMAHGRGENTNIDLGLSYVRYLIDSRTGNEANRQAYVIFITEGQPWPVYDTKQQARDAGESSSNSREAQGKNSRPSDYAANLHHREIAKAIRATGAEIYSIMIDRDNEYPADKKLWAEITTGNANNSSHLYYVGDSKIKISEAIKQVHDDIAKEIQQPETHSSKMIVTDYIETEYFTFNGATASAVCTPSIGNATIDPNTGKVTWNLGSNLPYGTTATLKIKIKLINDRYEGWLNTNDDDPTDDKCVFEYDEGSVPVPTPWLERELPKYKITEKWIDKATGQNIPGNAPVEHSVKENGWFTPDVRIFESLNYEHDSTTPSTASFQVVKNDEVIHKYTKMPLVTEKWLDGETQKEVFPSKNEYVKKETTYTPDTREKEALQKEYRYSSTEPSKNPVNITGNTTIIHWFKKIPMVKVIEEHKDIDTGEVLKTSEYKLEKGQQYNGKKETFSGYEYEYTNPEVYTNISVNSNVTITHYYRKTFKLTVKYINDETGKVMLEIPNNSSKEERKIKRNTQWPTNETLKDRYAIYDDPETAYNEITGYKGFSAGLELSGIKVDKKDYNLSNMPTKIAMTEDKVIEFHYKLKDAKLIKRAFYVKEVNGQITAVDNVKTATPETIQVGKKKDVAKLEMPAEYKGTYIGNNVIYTNSNNPVVTSAILKSLENTPKAQVKIEAAPKGQDQILKAFADFFYKEQYYTLTVKLIDTETKKDLNETITLLVESKVDITDKAPIGKNYPVNTTINAQVPDKIILPSGAEYKFVKRTDNNSEKTFSDPIVVDGNKTVIYEYKLQTIPVKIYYKEIVPEGGGSKLISIPGQANPQTVQAIPNSYIKAEDEPGKPTTLVNKIPEKYTFEYREGKGQNKNTPETADIGPITPGGGAGEYVYTFYYSTVPDEPVPPVPPGGGEPLPVVSYPKVTASIATDSNGNPIAVLGEEIKVKVPNKGYHKNMAEDMMRDEPAEGWNAWFAQVKYLICDFDVYCKEGSTYKLYEANKPIKIATREASGGTYTINENEITLRIPEWVEERQWKAGEEGYKISALVGSANLEAAALGNTSSEKYNILYEKKAAIGEIKVNVIGKVYDFTITNLIEDKYWPGSLYDTETEYKANLNPADNTIGILPIGQGTTTQQQQKYNHG
ncbi:MAG: hypothetical protein IKK43_05170, partial [Clostridia bacterium]|nr:hypothetical protein [Clostridia bacterium]